MLTFRGIVNDINKFTLLPRSGYSCFVIARRPEADEAISGILRFAGNRLHNHKKV
jgi:hypothetical protein